ncbi:MAG: AbrB/MazE/SpoVT family DNA-binding domain-containing protein [Gammaproteobacteria bacterium]
MHITQKGQVTIPQHIREKFGLLPHTEVEFIIQNDTVVLRRKAGSSQFKRMRGLAKGKFTTDEIMALTRK